MAQDLIKKEALFNEVKGSLFEYLVAREISVKGAGELSFHKNFDKNYLTILSQQDRMIRQFYPEMLPFLTSTARQTAEEIILHLGEIPENAKVVGKFSHSLNLSTDLFEADLVLTLKKMSLPVSLKLNKKNAFVNTKSGGIKSFFSQYFPFLKTQVQENFNLFIDREFNRMALELHALHDLEYPGHFQHWVRLGFSELPGELDEDSRNILKSYYARIAEEMHRILILAFDQAPILFRNSLPSLMGFSSSAILQVICFHSFPSSESSSIEIHSYTEVEDDLDSSIIRPFGNISSAEILMGKRILQIRVKPMNKFTTTAIKVNCSVRSKQPSSF
jgi:hypothetical protein